MTNEIDRRRLLRVLGLGAATVAGAGRASAETRTLVAATFPGTWSEADREVILPAFRALTGAGVTQSIILGTDQVSRLMAAKGNRPPFDVAFFDAPQTIDAVREGLIAEYPADQSPNFAALLPGAGDRWGPRITMQVIGLGYNPHRIATPPSSWDDLLDPAYRGRVGLTALNSQLGMAFLADLNRIRGGSEEDFEPAFRFLRQLLPNVGAVAANLGALAALWQQEQIDIAPYNFNFVETLRAKGVPVAFAIPASGAVGWSTSLHIVTGAADPALAVQYIDLHLDPAIQERLLEPPYAIIPTNGRVRLGGPVAASLGKTQADLAGIRMIDWAKLNPQRAALIDRFNREIRT